MRVWRLIGLATLATAALLLASGCSLGGDDDDDNGGEAVATTDTTTTTGDTGSASGNLLSTIQSRGTLNCGVNEAVPGFGFVSQGGEFEGFDIDYCKVVAAAVLGDAEAVEYKPLTAEQRFTALQSGEIDVLIRNTTRTASRDGSEGATFLTTTFYDGQGMMVRADSDYEELEDMEGATVCVLSGTTTELNLESQFQARGVDYTPLAFEDNDPLQQAFTAERCDGWTSDKSQLAGVRSNWPDAQGGPDGLRILEVTMSKEPLGPVVRDGDSNWASAVDWAIIATLQAEEFDISSENIDEALESDDPEVQRFLGQPVEGEAFDPGLGLEPDYAVEVIRAVGNYEEIYNRNVGPDSALDLERGLNSLWTDGGLHYPPPYR
ncbi:MAG TPA: amino acid ABC transporter substrate-binding protein [Gaiellaceae bacterium]|nr:amino acid ABC transporter substrate-binding protein [Gaiellaceae bacterium]